MTLSRGDADSAFLALRFRRWLSREGHRLDDPAFWLGINPHLSISDRPPSSGAPAYDAPWSGDATQREQLRVEGCALTPPTIPDADLAPLRDGVRQLVDAGLPAFCLLVYDDIYRLYARLRPALAPLLGDDPWMVPPGSWVFHVPAGADTRARWTTFGPHRDAYYPDPGVLAGDVPTTLVTWVALTNVSAADSCVYVVPAQHDPEYRTELCAVHPERVRLQDIRAMPAPAGSVLLMSGHLAHWGSRGSAFATAPRMSTTLMLQRRDVPPGHPVVLGFDEPMPLRTRLRVLYANLALILPKEELAPVERVLLG